MLYLFGPKETDFVNGDSDLIHHTYDEVVDRSKGFYLKFKVTLDKDESYKKIKKEMIINAYTPDGWNQFRVFDIYNHSNHVEVVATQLHYDLNYKKVFPFNLSRVTAQVALNVFVDRLKSDLPNFTFTSNIDDLRNFSTDDDLERLDEGHNALEILNRIASRWNGELDVNGYNVHLTHKLGKFTNALLYEHKNISEFADETSMSEVITRIHAVSRFRPERKEGDTEEPEEVTIKVVVDSPLINEYAQVYEEDYTNNDARTRNELISWARLKYSTNNIDKPARSIKVETNIIDGQEINYGDDLVLKYTKHDVDEVIRCVGYQYNPRSRHYISVTLGSNMNSLSSTITGAVHDSTKNQLSNIEKQVQIIRYASNNRNRVTTGPLAIPNPIDGDIWFYHPEGRPNEVELRIFQNGGWETIVSDMTGENIRKVLADMELEVEGFAEAIEANAQEVAAALDAALDAIANFSDSQEGFINIVGDDGKWVYSKNRLYIEGQDTTEVTSNEVVITLEDGEKVFTHNGEGFSIGNDYTFSFANPRFVERPHSVLTIQRSVNPRQSSQLVVKCHYEPYPDYSAENSNQTNTFNKCYHESYTITATSAWYETQTQEIEIDKNKTITLPVIYKTGNLTVTHNDATLEVV